VNVYRRSVADFVCAGPGYRLVGGAADYLERQPFGGGSLQPGRTSSNVFQLGPQTTVLAEDTDPRNGYAALHSGRRGY